MLVWSSAVALAGVLGVPILCAEAHTTHGRLASAEWILAAALLLFTCLPFIYEWLYRRSIEYVLTDQRLIVSKGLLSRTSNALLLNRVSEVTVEQSFIGRLAGFGSVEVIGFSGAGDVFYGIADPYAFQRLVFEQLMHIRGTDKGLQ
jgi:uncharacterized membrane protein YdbT with pleckstrin-like domain